MNAVIVVDRDTQWARAVAAPAVNRIGYQTYLIDDYSIDALETLVDKVGLPALFVLGCVIVGPQEWDFLDYLNNRYAAPVVVLADELPSSMLRRLYKAHVYDAKRKTHNVASAVAALSEITQSMVENKLLTQSAPVTNRDF